MHLCNRAVQSGGGVEDYGKHYEEDDPASAARGGGRDLGCDEPVQPALLCNLARALVGCIGVQPETRDEQKRRREEPDKQPVRKRAGQQGASDRRVALDEVEPDVDVGVASPGSLDACLENSCPLEPARDPPSSCRRDLDLERSRLVGVWYVVLGHLNQADGRLSWTRSPVVSPSSAPASQRAEAGARAGWRVLLR